MVSTEIIQTGAQMAQAKPSTPPSSPTQSSSEQLVTLSSVHQFIDMVKAVVAMEIASTPKCTCSAPSQPYIQPLTPQDLEQPLAQIVTSGHIQQLLDILKSLSTKEGPPPTSPDSIRASEGAKPNAPEDSRPQTAPASGLEFKTVNEVYVYNGP
jgi:hypothetical protein